jgi:hypothetical protein
MTRGFAALVLMALVWFSLAIAVRAEATTALSWVRQPGAEPCIAAAELAQRVERLIGPVLTSASRARLSIEGRIAPRVAMPGFAVVIVTSEPDGRILGQRELSSAESDCHLLDERLAFVIAIAIDPDAALAELPAEFSADNEPGKELLADLRAHPPRLASSAALSPARHERAERQAVPRRVRAPSLGFVAAFGPALAAGMLPAASLGLGLELGFATGSWLQLLRGGFWLPQSRALTSDQSVELSGLRLAIASCPELWAARSWRLAACASAVALRLAAQPIGFAGTSRDLWFLGPGLDARLARKLGGGLWAVLSIGAESMWPRSRVVYYAGGVPRLVHDLGPLTGFARVSVEMRF